MCVVRLLGLSLVTTYLFFSAADLAPAGQAERRDLDCAGVRSNIRLALAHHLSTSKLDERLIGLTIDRFKSSLLANREILAENDITKVSGDDEPASKVLSELEQGRCGYFERKSAIVKNALAELKRELGDNLLLERRLLHHKASKTGSPLTKASAPLSAINKKGIVTRSDIVVSELASKLSHWKDVATKEATARFLARRYFNRLLLLEQNLRNVAYDELMRSFMQSLDPNSAFLNEGELEKITSSSFAASYSGIGVYLSDPMPHGVRIVKLVEGGSAEATGRIEPDDVIMSVDRRLVSGLELDQLYPVLTGLEGSRIELHVAKLKGRRLVNHRRVKVTRKPIAQTTNALAVSERRLDGLNIVTVKLSKFYQGCAVDVHNAIASRASALEGSGGLNALVLDLRGNMGGNRDEAIYLAGLFISTGPIFGVNQRVNADEGRDRSAIKIHGDLVVAIDKATGSAAELVAGALKDYKRALIVGDERSFGKGTTQRVLSRNDGAIGGGLFVTTGLLYTPSGSSTQLVGVKSDIVVPGPRANAQTAAGLGSTPIASATFKAMMTEKEFAENSNLMIDFVLPKLQVESSLRLASKPGVLTAEEQLDEIERVAADFARANSGQ